MFGNLLLEAHAREKAGMPEEWKTFRWESFPKTTDETLYLELTGAVVPLKMSGANKGRPNWNKRDRSTQKTIVILVDEHQKWCRAWEQKSGQCAECVGKGQVVAGWSSDNGTRYRECRECKGTGKPHGQPTAA